MFHLCELQQTGIAEDLLYHGYICGSHGNLHVTSPNQHTCSYMYTSAASSSLRLVRYLTQLLPANNPRIPGQPPAAAEIALTYPTYQPQHATQRLLLGESRTRPPASDVQRFSLPVNHVLHQKHRFERAHVHVQVVARARYALRADSDGRRC